MSIGNFAFGFKIDVTTMDAINHFKTLNIGSLAVGEKGLVSMYSLRACSDRGELKVASISELDQEPNKYSYYYEATRKPNNKLDITLSRKGKKPDAEALQNAVIKVASLDSCQKATDKGIPLLSVDKFLNADSLTEILTLSNTVTEKTIKEKPGEIESSDATDIKNDWLKIESKSPIDDSPTVTLLKDAETGNQTLILRCKENSTDAFISTKDFLGEDSTSVMVRFDDHKAKKQTMSASTNNKSLFFSPAIQNIKTMMKSKKMVVRYQNYSGTPRTITFELSGLDKKISPLRKACHW